jgi:hypothetical protein
METANDMPGFDEMIENVRREIEFMSPEELKNKLDNSSSEDVAEFIRYMSEFEKEETQSYYNIIYDEDELRYFYDNVLPPLKQDEVYFVSLSARNKLLTEDQKLKIQLSRTEMFERRLIREREWIRFLRTIRKFETTYGAYTTKNGSNIPNEAIICYININPSSILKAYRDFNKQMNEYMYELAECITQGHDTDNIMRRIKKQDRLLMNSYQKARGTKHWIDLDFDVPKDNNWIYTILKNMVWIVKMRGGRAYIVDTRGGYHVLIDKRTPFDKQVNPKTLLEDAAEGIALYLSEGKEKNLKVLGYEAMINDNEMLPTPGTLQGGYKVRILNKENSND